MQVLPVYTTRYYKNYKTEFDKSIKSFLESKNYILGKKVENFEKKFAAFNQNKKCLGVADGTRALEIALRSICSSNNPHIFMPTHTAVATAMAVSSFVSLSNISLIDIADSHYNMCLKDLEDKYNLVKKNKNINEYVCVFVPIYGSLKGVKEISEFCSSKNIKFIIDSAQAHGAYYEKNQFKISNFSDISTYSFYPTKNLPAFGDAGAICFNKNKHFKISSLLREYGWETGKRNESKVLGFNSRLDEIQAGFLSVGLKNLNKRNKIRETYAKKYLEYFKNQKRISHYHKGCVFHQLVIETNNRNKFIDAAKKQGVFMGIHYPLHVGQQKPFKDISKSLKKANKLTKRIISIPISPEMNQNEAKYAFKVITELYEKFN